MTESVSNENLETKIIEVAKQQFIEKEISLLVLFVMV